MNVLGLQEELLSGISLHLNLVEIYQWMLVSRQICDATNGSNHIWLSLLCVMTGLNVAISREFPVAKERLERWITLSEVHWYPQEIDKALLGFVDLELKMKKVLKGQTSGDHQD